MGVKSKAIIIANMVLTIRQAHTLSYLIDLFRVGNSIFISTSVCRSFHGRNMDDTDLWIP